MKTTQKNLVAWLILAVSLAIIYDNLCHEPQFSLTRLFQRSSASVSQVIQ
jgi:hypothetical protein